MTGSTLIGRVRVQLRDIDYTGVATATKRGVFYTDSEILSFLNIAQDIFCNYCVETKKEYLLTILRDSQVYSTPATSHALPTNYFHYESASIPKFTGLSVPVKIYLGSEGVAMLNTNVDAAVILNTTVIFTSGRSNNQAGRLYYFKRPNTIIAGVFADSFPLHIYDLIVDYAALLLGFKEVQTSREFKRKKRIQSELALNPPTFAHYFKDIEKINDSAPSNTDDANPARR